MQRRRGEPGTFKDRALIRANPYQLVEGVVITGFAVGIEEAFICLKASFSRETELVTRAVEKFQTAGICGECKVTIVAGPDEYLFGEEKAMLEVIEGNEPLPAGSPRTSTACSPPLRNWAGNRTHPRPDTTPTPGRIPRW